MKYKTTLIAIHVLMSCASAGAAGMAELADDQLSEVNGQDGVYLNLKGFSFNSEARSGHTALTLTYTMPYAGTLTEPGDPLFRDPTKPVSYIERSGISISRSDPVDPFADPYQIQVETLDVPSQVRKPSEFHPADPDLTLPEKMEVIRVFNPKNLGAEQVWQMRYDWKVATGVVSGTPDVVHDMGSHIVEDLKFYGGGFDLAPAWSYKDKLDVKGTAFGLDLNMEVGRLILRPRGHLDDGTEMVFQGIKVGRANSDMTGVDPDRTKAWRIADVIQQPGIINAITDASGKSSFHMGIEWYRGDETDVRPESIGAISIDQVTIKNNSGTTNLGGMSIGGVQIRYLDVTFRNPN